MVRLKGQGVSRGIAQGKMYFLKRGGLGTIRPSGLGPQEEKRRLTDACREAAAQLIELAEKGRREAGEETALLFETHAMLVEDEDFVDCAMRMIEAEGCSAEYAVQAAGEQFALGLAGMDDPYMRERAVDIRDAAGRVIEQLTGISTSNLELSEPVILAADDLAPSETIRLDRKMILGFMTQGGSASSHTAILARTMGIPAICGLGDALREDYSGKIICMDGENGEVILDPDQSTMEILSEKYEKQQMMKRQLEDMKGKEDITLDGRKIELFCNIGSPKDINAVIENDGHGIGLFRSEFLYLAKQDYPDEEEQFAAYREAAEAMNGKRVVIRTLDIGADKQADYFQIQKEENPALGLRAIRICLNRPEIFRTQLRALYRASAYGKIAIMFPMITSLWEVRECKHICRQVMDELDREGVSYNRATELGIMIETPASVLIAPELASEVDFFSVGTNDLAQYTLACDRQAGGMGRFFDPHHPAVLRAIKMAADAAHEAGIWIGVCGELGADPELLSTFLAMGIDELSVSPSAVLPLRREIRGSVAEHCTLSKLEY